MSEQFKGCLPRTTKVGDGTFKLFSDKWLIPRKRWPDYMVVNPVDHIWRIVPQGPQNSCCACMGVGLVELLESISNQPRVALSQASIYGWDGIDSSGKPILRRRDNGMAIDTCLQILRHVGVSPIELNGKPFIDPYDWRGSRSWPENWREISSHRTVIEWLDCPTFEHMQSAACVGLPVGYGYDVHAVVRYTQHANPRPDRNSWPTWQDSGLGYWAETEREIERGISQYGAWAALVVSPKEVAGRIANAYQRELVPQRG